MAPEWAGKYARWVGTRASFVSTLLVGILAVITGLANIGAGFGGSVVVFGITVPGVVRQITAFTGTISGFLLLLSAFGLRRGLQAALYAVLALLPITVAQSVLQSTNRSIPLLTLSVVTFVLVLLNRRSFDRDLDVTTTQVAALSALAGSQAYGTIGTFTLREEHFDGVNTLLDAFYFSLVTGSTVGYGDITPRTAVGELFTLSMLVLTVSSFAAVAGVVLSPLIETRLSKALGRMTQQQLELLENHVLVLGYGDLTEPILEELSGQRTVVVVTPNEERARRLTERGYTAHTGDPSDEQTQRTARIETAAAVVTATNNDAEDALAILTARELNPDVTIVAAVTQRENADKLKRAGADTVISPISLGAHFLAESALGGENVEELERRLLGDASADTDGGSNAPSE
ncbi:NAD-binding protein [Halopelagius fulvigenes]|uniref:NAD-binding protein n=1 Tax=Halopelagius fulvigenes TaxID=1198324 RepID=A0ABD5U073_9EURY